MLIAIDGPAASGKGTLAARLASHYGLPHLDTGLLYRALAHALLEMCQSPDDAELAAQAAAHLDLEKLDREVLGGRMIGDAASRIAVHPQVREALLKIQRDFAARPEGAVLDGRDIGTVICPQADVKIFVTASPEVRAARRWRQLVAAGEHVTEWDILADIKKRDARDSTRQTAPLQRAKDAHLLDTSNLDIEGAVQAAVEVIDRSPHHEPHSGAA